MNVKNIIKIYTQLIDNKRPDIMSANVFYGPNRVIKVKSSSGAKRGQKLSEKYFYSNNKKCSNSYSDVASLASLEPVASVAWLPSMDRLALSVGCCVAFISLLREIMVT